MLVKNRLVKNLLVKSRSVKNRSVRNRVVLRYRVVKTLFANRWFAHRCANRFATQSLVTAARQRGFTLIELLVVIALMASITAIALPQLWGQFTAQQQRQQVESFWREIQQQAQFMRRYGENFVFSSDNEHWQKAAADQQLNLLPSRPIVLRADGFTQGGDINLQALRDQRQWRITITMPDGDVTIAPQ